MLPLLQNELIHSKKWFTEDEFLDAVAVCQSMPGVVAVNMASYVGYRRKGALGSLIATIGVVLPSFVIILAIASGLARLGDNRYVNGAMAGFRAAALGLVLVSVFQLGSAVFRKGSKLTMAAAAAAFALIVLLHVNTAYVILLFLALGIIASIVRGRNANADASTRSDNSIDPAAADESGANADGGGK